VGSPLRGGGLPTLLEASEPAGGRSDASSQSRTSLSSQHDDRPWGSYDVVDEGSQFKVKRLVVKPGQQFSYQRHTLRAEHWYVVAGDGVVTLDGRQIRVSRGDAVDIAVGAAHRATNAATDGDLILIEVQTGSYFGEDDIVRLDDDYGRNA
jgi:mannose-6-phosphate isomerase